MRGSKLAKSQPEVPAPTNTQPKQPIPGFSIWSVGDMGQLWWLGGCLVGFTHVEGHDGQTLDTMHGADQVAVPPAYSLPPCRSREYWALTWPPSPDAPNATVCGVVSRPTQYVVTCALVCGVYFARARSELNDGRAPVGFMVLPWERARVCFSGSGKLAQALPPRAGRRASKVVQNSLPPDDFQRRRSC